MASKIDDFCILLSTSLRDCMTALNNTAKGIILVVDDVRCLLDASRIPWKLATPTEPLVEETRA